MGVKCSVYLVLRLPRTMSKKKWVLICTNFLSRKISHFYSVYPKGILLFFHLAPFDLITVY